MRGIRAEDVILKARMDAFYRDSITTKSEADKQALKNYYWYTKDSLGIKEGIRRGLTSILGKDETIDWYPFQIHNDVPRLVKRLSLVYLNPAVRTYENLSEEHEQIITANIDIWFREFDRQATLLNTVLVRPIYDAKSGKFTYRIMGRQFANVITYDDNPHEIKEVNYSTAAMIRGVEQEVVIHWTDNEHWATDLGGNDVTRFMPEVFPDGRINIYGRIPFAVLRLEHCNDFWGDGLSDYVNLCESNSMLLTSAYIKQWLTFGYGLGVNCDLEDNLKMRPNQFIAVEVSDFSKPEPKIEFVTPDHDTKGDTEYIDYSRKTALNSFGFGSSSLSTDSNQMSGYAKTIDNIEIQDFNNDKIPVFESFERDFFELQKLELRASGVMVNESAQIVNIIHQKYEMPKSNTEIWLDREKEYQFDMSNPVTWLMQDNPSLTEEDARQIIINNKKFKVEAETEARGRSLIERIRGLNAS